MSNKYEIKEMEVDKDHIHMLIDYLPSESISNIVKQLKKFFTISYLGTAWKGIEASILEAGDVLVTQLLCLFCWCSE